MATARKNLISLDDTPYYHCFVRCVRRAFICGEDKYSGQNYDHRRDWIRDKILEQIELFSIDCCAYAVMSNHYHVVLFIDEQEAQSWGKREVLKRWKAMYSMPYLAEKYYKYESLSKAELDAVYVQIETYRERLMSLSWFMRGINESVARRANAEDNCKGRFWESRFKSQALLDEQALLTCMTYVDLNPIRAQMTHTPEQSDYTSIQERIKQKNSSLKRFGTEENDIPFALNDYIQLVDMTGRAFVSEQKGMIPEELPDIINRLGLNNATWFNQIMYFDKWYYKAIGSVEKMKRYCQSIKQKYIKGLPKVLNTISKSVNKTLEND